MKRSELKNEINNLVWNHSKKDQSEEIMSLIDKYKCSKEPEWISLKDRLPTELTQLIVFEPVSISHVIQQAELNQSVEDIKTVKSCFYDPSENIFVVLDPNGNWIKVNGVTHWMEMPDAPIEK